MTTKDAVLELLRKNADQYVSGAQCAETLSLSRTAVWKAVEQLRSEGYRIESGTNRGYRLSKENDVLSAEGIIRFLRHRELRVEVYPSVSSTNTLLKARAAEGAAEGLVLAAGAQTQGRGRMGRSFWSPPDSGLYMSILLRPALDAAEATGITACAAVAAAEAVEALSGREVQIKWVNDLLLDGKKICGILSEAAFDFESGRMDYVIVGIGVNTRLPAEGFPEDISRIAGAVFGRDGLPELRCRLAAQILDRLMDDYPRLAERPFYEAYRRRSMVLDRDIDILAAGQEPVPAHVVDLAPDFALIVQRADGTVQRLSSGEVSVRVTEQ